MSRMEQMAEMVARLVLDDIQFMRGLDKVEREAEDSAKKIESAYRNATANIPREFDSFANKGKSAMGRLTGASRGVTSAMSAMRAGILAGGAALVTVGAAANRFRTMTREARMEAEGLGKALAQAGNGAIFAFGSAIQARYRGNAGAGARGVADLLDGVSRFALGDEWVDASNAELASRQRSERMPGERAAQLQARIALGNAANTPAGRRDAARAEAELAFLQQRQQIQQMEGAGREPREALTRAARAEYLGRLDSIGRRDFGEQAGPDQLRAAQLAMARLEAERNPGDINAALYLADLERRGALRSAEREVRERDDLRPHERAAVLAARQQVIGTEFDARREEIRTSFGRRDREAGFRAQEIQIDAALTAGRAAAAGLGDEGERRVRELEAAAAAAKAELEYRRQAAEAEEDQTLTTQRRAEILAALAAQRDAAIAAAGVRPAERRAFSSRDLVGGLVDGSNIVELLRDGPLDLPSARSGPAPPPLRPGGAPAGAASRDLSTIGNQQITLLREIRDKLPNSTKYTGP